MTTSLTHHSASNRLDRIAYFLSRHWLLVFSLGLGLYVGLPFLAPILMHLGLKGPAGAIYLGYSLICHQLPERSFFLFGPKATYSLEEVQATWENTLDPLVLRQFIGNPGLGWKAAWSDRMVAMYTSILVYALLWWPLRGRVKPLPWWGLVLFSLPLMIDGSAHFISDLAGVEQGFRAQNDWFSELTRNAFPPSFYVGVSLGSFNSWMRLLTGLLFGLGVVWFGFPHLDRWFAENEAYLEAKLQGKNSDVIPDEVEKQNYYSEIAIK